MPLLHATARWIFLAALVYAPWAYGGTTSASIQIINWLLLAAFILWIIELVVSGRSPARPRLLVFLTCALIGVGGWMALNAKSIYDSDFYTFVPLRNFAPHLTGSVDRCRSAGQYVADGPVHRAIVTDCDLPEVWTGASAKAFARGKRRRFCGGDRHSPNPDCGGAGGSSGSTAQPVANVDPKRAKRRSLDGRARSNWRPS